MSARATTSTFARVLLDRERTGALNLASVVAVPQRKQMSALSAISVPHCRQIIVFYYRAAFYSRAAPRD
jgi:hypothetical protein